MVRIAIFALLQLFVLHTECMKTYNGYTVYRLRPQTLGQLNILYDLAENESKYDFWTYPSSLNVNVDVMVSPENKNQFLKLLTKHKIITEIMIENLQTKLNRESIESQTQETRDIFDDYQSHDDILSFLDSTASANSAIASTESIGTSYDGRNLKIIKIGINQSSTKPVVFINGGIHAREWIAPATALYITHALVDGYNNNDESIKTLLTQFDWHIHPVVNPDGYEYSRTTDRMWRKTRRPNSGSTCIGTDADRNFGYKWMTGGSSSNPCSDTYAGPSAFSEIEAQVISDYILKINTNKRVKVFMSLHSYSQLWLYPWGWTNQLTPDNDDLNARAKTAVTALTAIYGTKYTIANHNGPIIYGYSGCSHDWAYGTGEIKYTYYVELRDTGRNGFVLPPSEIIPSGIETWTGIKELVQEVVKEL